MPLRLIPLFATGYNQNELFSALFSELLCKITTFFAIAPNFYGSFYCFSANLFIFAIPA